MNYGLEATFLSKKQCKSIESQSNHVFLNAIGFPKSFPSPMVSAPKTAGGVGFRNLWVEQGSVHAVKIVLGQGRRPTGTLSETLRTTYCWYHLYTGRSQHPFKNKSKSTKYVPKGWISDTEDFLYDSNMTVYWPEMQDLPPRRVGDGCLMDDAHDGTWSKAQLDHINNCRMYLKVEYISDMCNQLGTEVLSQAVDWIGQSTTSRKKNCGRNKDALENVNGPYFAHSFGGIIASPIEATYSRQN